MVMQIALDRTLDSSWRIIFTRPSYLKRAGMALFLIIIIIGCSGVQVINSYGTVLFKNLGYSSQKQLLFQALLYVISTPSNLFASVYVDKVSRVKMICFGLSTLVIFTSIYTALVKVYVGTTNTGALQTAVAMTFLFNGFYGGTVDAPSFFYPTELWPMHLRARGTVISLASIAAVSIIFVAGAPTGIQNLGWKFYLIEIILTTFGIIVIALFLPQYTWQNLRGHHCSLW